MTRCAGAAAVLMVVATILAGCGDGDPDSLGPVPAEYEYIASGDEIVVRLPVGAVRVTLGEGVEKVEDSQAEDGAEHEAPDGRVYVPVSITLDASANDQISGVADGAFERADLSLETGDREIDLGDAFSVDNGRAEPTPATIFVPMTADERSEVTVIATYDDLEQRLDLDGTRDAGAAEAYYDGRAGRGAPVVCADTWQVADGSLVEAGCEATPAFTPYLPGVGWAEDRRMFVVVDARVRPLDVRVDGRATDPQPLSVTATLSDGRQVRPDPRIGTSSPSGATQNLMRLVYFDAVDAESHELRLDADVWGVAARATATLARG